MTERGIYPVLQMRNFFFFSFLFFLIYFFIQQSDFVQQSDSVIHIYILFLKYSFP